MSILKKIAVLSLSACSVYSLVEATFGMEFEPARPQRRASEGMALGSRRANVEACIPSLRPDRGENFQTRLSLLDAETQSEDFLVTREAQVEQRLQELEKQIDDVRELARQYIELKAELEAKKAKYEADTKSLLDHVQPLVQANTRLKAENERLNDCLNEDDRWVRPISVLQPGRRLPDATAETIPVALDIIVQRNRELSHLETEVRSLESRLQATEDVGTKLIDLQSEIDRLNSEKESLNEQLADLRAGAITEQDFAQQNEELRRTRDDLASSLSIASSQLTALVSTKAKLTQKLEQEEANIRNLQKHIEELRRDNRTFQRDAEQRAREAAKKETEAQVARLKIDLGRAHEQLELARREAAAARRRLAERVLTPTETIQADQIVALNEALSAAQQEKALLAEGLDFFTRSVIDSRRSQLPVADKLGLDMPLFDLADFPRSALNSAANVIMPTISRTTALFRVGNQAGLDMIAGIAADHSLQSLESLGRAAALLVFPRNALFLDAGDALRLDRTNIQDKISGLLQATRKGDHVDGFGDAIDCFDLHDLVPNKEIMSNIAAILAAAREQHKPVGFCPGRGKGDFLHEVLRLGKHYGASFADEGNVFVFPYDFLGLSRSVSSSSSEGITSFSSGGSSSSSSGSSSGSSSSRSRGGSGRRGKL
ncbi:MAG: hypothetical protein LBL99_02105 [Holosporaceae bacterium]|jgi:hypothetical protein|nr:hypothetical protein [Holosporaceae bacterium]